MLALFCTLRFQERERLYREGNGRSFWDLPLLKGFRDDASPRMVRRK